MDQQYHESKGFAGLWGQGRNWFRRPWEAWPGTRRDGRSGRIRTCDPRVPNAVLYQTEPHSDLRARLIGKDSGACKEPIFAC